MPYITQQQLIDRFTEAELIELTDHADAGDIDATVLDGAIADADDQINDALRAIYTVPIDPVPSALIAISGDIVRWRLYDDAIPEAVQKRYDDAISRLKAYADGKAVLDVGTEEKPPKAAIVKAPAEVFTETLLGTMP